MIIEVRGKTPNIGEDCYIAENATIVGDVIIGDQCSIWFNAVLRGDVHKNWEQGKHTGWGRCTLHL